MADKNAQLVPVLYDSIESSAARSNLLARGRRDATTLRESLHRGSIFVPAQVLNVLIARTLVATGSFEKAPVLNQLLLILKPTSLVMVATVAHRMSLVEKTGELIQGLRDEVRVLIPHHAAQQIHLSLLNQPALESSLFIKGNDTFTFHIGKRTVSWVRPSENFPDFEAVMSRSMPQGAASVVVAARDLHAAVQRVTPSEFDVFHIRLCLEHGALRITGLTSNGEYKEVIPASYTERTVQGVFMARYLGEFLAAIEEQGDVTLRLNDLTSALEVEFKRRQTGYKCRYLCASMRDRSPRGQDAAATGSC